jgi:hypothetical protein
MCLEESRAFKLGIDLRRKMAEIIVVEPSQLVTSLIIHTTSSAAHYTGTSGIFSYLGILMDFYARRPI